MASKSPQSKKTTNGNSLPRCASCGGQVQAGESVKRISDGKYKDGVFVESKVWGVLHTGSCFNTAIDSPDLFYEEVKRAAKAK